MYQTFSIKKKRIYKDFNHSINDKKELFVTK